MSRKRRNKREISIMATSENEQKEGEGEKVQPQPQQRFVTKHEFDKTMELIQNSIETVRVNIDRLTQDIVALNNELAIMAQRRVQEGNN
jgi:transcription initiation factor IIF auxiliary subunit